jgi:hypothetical protein
MIYRIEPDRVSVSWLLVVDAGVAVAVVVAERLIRRP